MRRILVPMDGSKHAVRALEFVAGRARRGEQVLIDLLYVQPDAMPTEYITQQMIDRWQKKELQDAFADPRIEEIRLRLKGKVHVQTGDAAEKIVKFARKKHCREIVMGTRGFGRLKGLLMGSIATKVVQLANVPVTLVK